MRFFSTVYFRIIATLAGLFILCNDCIVNHNKDLDVFVGASKLVFEGKSCYFTWFNGLKYYYSPLFAVLMFPLTALPQIAYDLVWLSFNLLIAMRIIKLLPFFLDIKALSPEKKRWFYFLLVLSVGRFFYDTFSLGQMTIILLWGSMESLRLFKTGRQLTGSMILALIINIKIIPVALLAYLVYKKELKAAGFTCLFMLIYLFLPALILGFSFNNLLLSDWLRSLTETNSNSMMEDYGRQSLSSLIPALFTDTPLQFDLKRNIMQLPAQQVTFILNMVRLALVILLAWLFGRPFRRLNKDDHAFYDLALICLVTPMFFPHQGKYSYFYLLPAYAYCIYQLMCCFSDRKPAGTKMRTALICVIISFVLATLTTDGLVGRRLSDLFEYFNCVTIGSCFLLMALALLKPAKHIDAATEAKAMLG